MVSRKLMLCFVVLVFRAEVSMGQVGTMPPKDEDGKPILGGPDVVESESSGRSQFGESMDRRGRQPSLPVERWLRLVRSLDLTPDQQAAINEHEKVFRAAAREYREANAQAFREIESARQEAREKGERPAPEVQQRERALRQKAPTPIAAQEAIWNLLDEFQQQTLRERVAAEMDRITQRRRAEMRGETGETEMIDDAMMGEQDEAGDSRERTAPGGFSPATERRLRFLRDRQLHRPKGAPPTGDDMDFEFDDR